MLDRKLEIKLERERTGVTMKEIADYMKVSETTVRRWIDDHNSEKIDQILATIKEVESLKS